MHGMFDASTVGLTWEGAMRKSTMHLAAIAATVSSLALGVQNANAALVWTYTGTNSNGMGLDTASPGAPALTTTGVYATNAVAGTGCSSGTCTTMSSGISGSWVTSTTTNSLGYGSSLQFYSGGGLGMDSDGNTPPNHALDNAGYNTEGVLLQFASSIILAGVDPGYVSGDADISVFRYTGSSAPAMSCNSTINTTTGTTASETGACTGASLSAMNAAGWQLVGNYGDLISDNSVPYTYNSINASNLSSSYWLITAYDNAYGAATTGTVNQGDDYFKLLSLAGVATTNQVPEPGSLALVSLALFGVLCIRRRFVDRG
jgi:hypothetical protein